MTFFCATFFAALLFAILFGEKMKFEQYTSLIQKLEAVAENNPSGYERRVSWLAKLGFAYFGAIFVAFLVIPLFLVGVLILKPGMLLIVLKVGGKLIIFLAVGLAGLAAVVWDLLRTLWSKTPPPEGIEISREQAPRLFETIERVSKFLKAPVPDHVIISDEFNAAVLSQPRVGIFGQRSFMLLGLPLMQAVSPGQLEAVIAHELGHLSERHSKSAASAYRVRAMWSRFLESQEADGHKLSFLYGRFLNWYFPYFNAYSFVLCRRQEREADTYAVELCGSRPLGEALIHLDVKSRILSQKFWKDVLNEAADDRTPPNKIYTRMAHAFRASDRAAELQNLSKAVAVNTDYSDSHPSLNERLRTMGYWDGNDLPELPAPVVETAADRHLGKFADELAAMFDEAWTERARAPWIERHELVAATRKRLAELAEKEASEPLSDDEILDRASGHAEIGETSEAIATLRSFVDRNPDHAEANFGLGVMLMDEDDESGIAFAERSFALDRRFKATVCERVYYFLRGVGRDEEAKRYMIELEGEQEAIEAANVERMRFVATDQIGEHKLTPEQVESIRGKIMYYDEISTAYAARKIVGFYDEEAPFNVLFIEMSKAPLFGGGARLKAADLVDVLAQRVGEFGVAYIVVLDKGFEKLLPQLKEIEGSVIYRAEKATE